MQSKHGKNVMVFLTERINALRQLQESLANQLLQGQPTAANHPEFIIEVIRIQEQLSRCEALRNALGHALLDKTSLSETVQRAMTKMDEAMSVHFRTIREQPNTLPAALAKESLNVILALQVEFSQFLAEEPTSYSPA